MPAFTIGHSREILLLEMVSSLSCRARRSIFHSAARRFRETVSEAWYRKFTMPAVLLCGRFVRTREQPGPHPVKCRSFVGTQRLYRAAQMVLPEWIEHSTSPLPRGCSTTELRQRENGADGTKAARTRRKLP
jgi:hypothetical protein